MNTGRQAGTDGRIVIVGASLAGLRAAEALRDQGFKGQLTLIGDEPYAPYDRPPLSKTVLSGWLPVSHTYLPQMRDIQAEWLLGVAATNLNLSEHVVELADGRRIPFDRLLITTGTRARPWPDAEQMALDGVFSIRTLDDGQRLREVLAANPKRVLVIGAGFTGSEVASVCRELGLPVTVAERSAAPLAGALGGAAGMVAARFQRANGVDLRCNVTVLALEGDANGHLRRAHLSDGDALEIDVAVVALGAVRNVEWLLSSGLAVDARGVVCDGACRAFDANGIVLDDIFVAGDVARWPHPLYDGQLLAVEHWGNAVEQAETAAHNMLCEPAQRKPHRPLPTFWSNQFGLNIKAVGLPTVADQIVVTQGAVERRRFVAAYGLKGRLVAAVAVNMPRSLGIYAEMIQERAAFPPRLNAPDGPEELQVRPSGFPAPGQSTHSPVATSTGPGPGTPPQPAGGPDMNGSSDPRVPSGPTSI
ncbi:pyridine nucleotide-disulfide oxidoreductase [Dictyobacter alpinus]|uniref:Pyridine nucleotide-disulfide oxidoreductase n=1 Tax=Dictyobacter alpinus TaxID=2014873 RepID=A0A402BBU5_9CHLR|nr:FAD-dependent oxidoreductase [Dictyobacter alpinus]GCE28901.1 pyridine nucleotide-disulfide oxidoreductase [Dictyobacter alpinus]